MAVIVNQRYRMRYTDQMEVDARLAYMLMRVPERLPEATPIVVTAVSDNGKTKNIHVKQWHAAGSYGQAFGPVLSYPEELFKAWFQRIR